MSPPKRNRGICPNCHLAQEEALHTGLVGCPICYEMLDDASLAHFGVVKGTWMPEKAWPWEITD